MPQLYQPIRIPLMLQKGRDKACSGS